MRQLLLAGAALAILVGADRAGAQTCSSITQWMSALNIKNKVVGNYTCVGTFPHATWNELLSGNANSGNVIDYKLGPTDPIDPTTKVGTYTVSGTTIGILTYTYGATSYSYQIEKPTTPGSSFVTMFCPVPVPTGPGYTGLVNVQPSHC